jgi:hypothetical protein
MQCAVVCTPCMLESVHTRVILFIFARVHIQSAYHSEQTHFEPFACITSDKYLVWVCMVYYMVTRATPQPIQVYATWCGPGGVYMRGCVSPIFTYLYMLRAYPPPDTARSFCDHFNLSACSDAGQASWMLRTVRIYWIKVRSEILSHPTPKTHCRMNEISRKFPHSREVCKNGLGGEGASQTRRKWGG